MNRASLLGVIAVLVMVGALVALQLAHVGTAVFQQVTGIRVHLIP